VLLLADPERRAEQEMLAGAAIAADAVIVPHHGSATSSAPEFVAAVGARWALVSAGFGNRWGLPRREVSARWREIGAEVLTTADGGALRFQVGADPSMTRMQTWRGSDPRWWRSR
jgi:competence protein ComEC